MLSLQLQTQRRPINASLLPCLQQTSSAFYRAVLLTSLRLCMAVVLTLRCTAYIRLDRQSSRLLPSCWICSHKPTQVSSTSVCSHCWTCALLSIHVRLPAGPGKPAFAELLDLQIQALRRPMDSSLLPSLESLVAVVEQWLQRCGKAIARRSAQTPRTCLEAMAASVQRAQEQMESQLRKLQVSYPFGHRNCIASRNACGVANVSGLCSRQDLLVCNELKSRWTPSCVSCRSAVNLA